MPDPAEDAQVEDIEAPPPAKSRIWMIRLISIVLVLGAWEIVGRRVNPLFLSSPSAILKADIQVFMKIILPATVPMS